MASLSLISSSKVNMWMKMDSFYDTRARKRLSLPDRVRAIQSFDNIQNTKTVAKLFNCSTGQIRNILMNKEKTLALYAKDKRARKIVFLGKVISEWFHRAQRSPSMGLITFQMAKLKLNEAKRLLDLENFEPNIDWFCSYSIKEVDVKMLRVSVDGNGQTSLNIQAIIDYMKVKEGFDDEPEFGLECTSLIDDQSQSSASSCSLSLIEQRPAKIQKLEVQDNDLKIELYNSGPNVINNFNEAIKYLKPLEDFVLLKENYRAIGLIVELEKIFSKASTSDQN